MVRRIASLLSCSGCFISHPQCATVHMIQHIIIVRMKHIQSGHRSVTKIEIPVRPVQSGWRKRGECVQRAAAEPGANSANQPGWRCAAAGLRVLGDEGEWPSGRLASTQSVFEPRGDAGGDALPAAGRASSRAPCRGRSRPWCGRYRRSFRARRDRRTSRFRRRARAPGRSSIGVEGGRSRNKQVEDHHVAIPPGTGACRIARATPADPRKTTSARSRGHR